VTGLRSGHTVGLTANHNTHSAPEVTTRVITAGVYLIYGMDYGMD